MSRRFNRPGVHARLAKIVRMAKMHGGFYKQEKRLDYLIRTQKRGIQNIWLARLTVGKAILDGNKDVLYKAFVHHKLDPNMLLPLDITKSHATVFGSPLMLTAQSPASDFVLVEMLEILVRCGAILDGKVASVFNTNIRLSDVTIPEAYVRLEQVVKTINANAINKQ